jgi:Tfp pilus assembly protein PilF
MGVLSEDDGRARLYPLEVAAVAVAALRSEGVDAMVAEVARFPGDRSPPDPSGHFGYYGVAVYAETVGEGTPEVFDPYGGRGTEPEDDDVRVLNDVQVLGAVENHLAIHRLVREGEPALALARSESALALDPRSPQTHSVAGAVLLLGGGAEQGQAEFEAAFQLRPDAPRHNQMAGLALAGQPPDLERANREVAAALEQHEDYAAARLTMAAIHLARRETDEAARELERAEGLDPDLPNLAMMWANYYLTTNEPERAAEKAEEAIEAQPHDWRSRLSAARVLRAAGRFDAMRAQARAIMEMVSGAERSRVEQLILHPDVLGPTALEDDIFDEEIGDEELGALHEGGFQLGADSALLGEGEEPAFGGSLLGDEELGEGLPNLGDPSRLRLGSGGSGPRLDLSE